MRECCSSDKKQHSSGDNRLVILLVVAGALIVGGVVLGLALGSGGSAKSDARGKIAMAETKFDAGDVSMASGKYTHTYKFRNSGAGSLNLSKLETSCMCTTAKIRYRGKDGPEFGMPGMGNAAPFWGGMEIAPGDEAELIVIFDPNAHGPDAVGLIKRGIIITTDDPENREIEVFFSANVTR